MTFKEEKLLTAEILEKIDSKPSRSMMVLSILKRWYKCSKWQVAAASIILVLLLSLFVPPLTRTIAAIPILGSGYTQLLRSGGLDIAYQAGLITELNRSVSKDDITLSAVAAYSDRLISTYVLKISHAENTFAYWQQHEHRLGLQGEEKGKPFTSGWAHHYHYDAAEDAVYCLASKETSLPWWTRLRVIYQNEDLKLQLTVPVQKVSDRETIILAKEMSGGAVLQSITFTQARTQINSRSDSRIPVWGILLPDGEELLPRDHDRWIKKSHSLFPATTAEQLTVVLKGYEEHEKVVIPLQVGAEYQGRVNVRITDIEPFSSELVNNGQPSWRIRATISPFHRYLWQSTENGIFSATGELITGYFGFGGRGLPDQQQELVITILALAEEEYYLQFTVIVIEEINEQIKVNR